MAGPSAWPPFNTTGAFWHTEFDSSEVVEVTPTFAAMKLREELIYGIFVYGFERPSAVQRYAIKTMIEGRDVLAHAQICTGKTAAFCIAALQSIDTSVRSTQILCLSPTREMAIETQEMFLSLGRFMGARCRACIGGTDIRRDIHMLDEGQHIVSGTPGRVYDLFQRRVLNPRHIKMLCVDEIDEVVSKGLERQIYDIFCYLPRNVQVCVTSATVHCATMGLTADIMSNNVAIIAKRDKLTLDGLDQYFVNVYYESFKVNMLHHLLNTWTATKVAIFCNASGSVGWLTHQIRKLNLPIMDIHENMSRRDRHKKINEFRRMQTGVLISTGEAAREINVQDIPLKINYDLPWDPDLYLERVGCSVRCGVPGTAISLVKANQIVKLKNIEYVHSTQINSLF